jgi:hypothetical protein
LVCLPARGATQVSATRQSSNGFVMELHPKHLREHSLPSIPPALPRHYQTNRFRVQKPALGGSAGAFLCRCWFSLARPLLSCHPEPSRVVREWGCAPFASRMVLREGTCFPLARLEFTPTLSVGAPRSSLRSPAPDGTGQGRTMGHPKGQSPKSGSHVNYARFGGEPGHCSSTSSAFRSATILSAE